MLDNTPNQSSKFSTKSWLEVNDDLRGTYSADSQIKFKTSMQSLSLCYYSDTYTLVERTITVTITAAADANLDNRNKEVTFKML